MPRLDLPYGISVHASHDGGTWRPWCSVITWHTGQLGEPGSTMYPAWTLSGTLRKAMRRTAGPLLISEYVKDQQAKGVADRDLSSSEWARRELARAGSRR